MPGVFYGKSTSHLARYTQSRTGAALALDLHGLALVTWPGSSGPSPEQTCTEKSSWKSSVLRRAEVKGCVGKRTMPAWG